MKKIIIILLKIILIAIVLELMIFNITSYRTFWGKYEKREFSKDQIQLLKIENGVACYQLKNLNIPIATIKIQLKDKDIKNVYEYYFSYSDETSNNYQNMPSKEYVEGYHKSQYTVCYLSGNVNKLLLHISENIAKDDLLEKITINESVPIQFNAIRVVILIAIIASFYCVKHATIMEEEYSTTNLKQEIILLGIIFIFALLLYVINIYSVAEDADNMYNKDMVDAISHRSLSLLTEPSKAFLQLDNPYDTNVRDSVVSRGKDYIWDAAYYQGKFYMYFGILPVLIIFLPYHILTGQYLKIGYVGFLLSFVVIIMLKEILCKILKRYLDKIPFQLVIYFLIMLCAGSLVLYLNGSIRFYEIPIISGLLCVLLGINFMLQSMEQEDKKYRYIALSCTFMALSVACRPTDLLASLIIIPYLLKQLIETTKQIKYNKKLLIKCILAICIPYMIVGIALMWYNFARFGNVFEFGAKYQLTIQNMTTLKSRIFTIPVGLICNLFSIPNVIPDFPFITNHNKIVTFFGYYYIENMIGGLFILAPICFACFFIKGIYQKTKNKALKWGISLLLITGSMIAVVSIVMAGSTERYLVDYAWMFVLAGILIYGCFYQILKSMEAKKIMIKILGIITVYTLLINILAGIVSEKSFFKQNSPEVYDRLKYSICFWE